MGALWGIGACIWKFPKIRGTVLGVPVKRTIVFWHLYLGLLFRETTRYWVSNWENWPRLTYSGYDRSCSGQIEETKWQ